LIGDTFQARDDVVTSCGADGAADVVYRLDVAKRSHIVANIAQDEGRHVLALTSSCSGKSAELACGNRVDHVVAPGTYYLVADGASVNAFGRFRLNYRVDDMTLTDQACSAAQTIALGQSVSGTTKNGQNHFASSCGGSSDDQDAADKVYKFTLSRKATINATVLANDFVPVLSIRSACADQGSERACVNNGGGAPLVARRELDPGTYYVIVDGRGDHAEGDFTLSLAIQSPGADAGGDEESQVLPVPHRIAPGKAARPVPAGKAGSKTLVISGGGASKAPGKAPSKAPANRPVVH
jgi:hypothetical protein